jgi:hypothetical protein
MDNWQNVGLEFANRKFGRGKHLMLCQKKTRYCGLMLIRSSFDDQRWIIKMIMPDEIGAGDEELAKFFNATTAHFRSLLLAHNVPLAKSYEFDVFERFAVQTSSYEGKNCEEIISLTPKEAVEIFSGIMRAIRCFLLQPKPLVGLDPQLSNFCRPSGRVVYTDTFPPLCLYEGRYLVHYPNPPTPEEIEHELARKFRPLGILRRLRFSGLAIHPKFVGAFEESLDVLDDPLRREAKDFFATVPNGSIGRMTAKEILSFIDGLDPYDVETRREIAALVIPCTASRARVLQEIFVQTSQVPLPHFPPLAERLKAYRHLVAGYLEV